MLSLPPNPLRSLRSTLWRQLAYCAAGLAVVAAAGQPGSAAQPDPESPAAREARLAWFKEAKFGLFIHWGLYAIPAGYWKGERARGIGEWIMKRMKVPVREYERLAGGFNPIRFDAEAWAQVAADAGMKYVVITAKHHDGFWLPPFKNRIKSVTHIEETGKRVPLKVETLPDGRRCVKISLMAVRDTMGAVVLVEIAGDSIER